MEDSGIWCQCLHVCLECFFRTDSSLFGTVLSNPGHASSQITPLIEGRLNCAFFCILAGVFDLANEQLLHRSHIRHQSHESKYLGCLYIYIFLYLEADQVQHIQIHRWQLITLSGVLLHGWLKSLSSKGTIYDLKLKHAGSKREFSDWIFNLNSDYHILAVPIETMHRIP